MRIDASMFGGSIEVLRVPPRGTVELALRSDSAADVRQWFCFRVDGGGARPRELIVHGAGDATYPNGWSGYRAMVTNDGRSWRRATTHFDGDALRIRHDGLAPSALYAYFAEYSLERLERELARLHRCPWADVGVLGLSPEERPVYLADVGDEDDAKRIWIVARQHPGETPASWLVEGLLRRLRQSEDPEVRSLLARARLSIVPLANPDGAALGNMRTSATGANLNRVWDDPDEDDTPEVVAMLEAMDEGGVDLFVDVHADEASTYAFAACSEGNPSYDEGIAVAEAELREDLAELFPEFVDEAFYGLDEPGEADLSCAANQVGERFGCPSITLELPIKDGGDGRVRPGWSPLRASRAGAALVSVLRRAIDRLDGDDD